MVLYFRKNEFPLLKDALLQVWLTLALLFSKVVDVFLLCRYYLPWKWVRALRLNKIEYPLPKDVLFQVWLKLASGSGEEKENMKGLR